MEILGSIIVSVIQSILFYNKEIGISMLLFLLIANGIIYYILYKKNKVQNKMAILLIIPIILLGSTYFIFANKTFNIINIFVIITLNIIMYVMLTHKKDSFKNYLSALIELLLDDDNEIEFTKEKLNIHLTDKIKKMTMSVFIVLIVVGIIIILLSSADSIFANLFSGIGNLFEKINFEVIFNLILRLMIIIITYFLFLKLVLKLQKDYNTNEEESSKINKQHEFTIKLLLIALNIVYIVFCFIQIKALFAKNVVSNYAGYARTGFFQLMFVSLINCVIILISNKYNEKSVKILNLLLVIYTVIIAISSIYRMHMYEMEYGLTYLRTFVYIILVTEIICFVPITVYIFNKKFDFVKWCFVIIISSYCLSNYINLENIIIDKNINRPITTIPVDYSYISKIITEDGYSTVQEKLEDENITAKEKEKYSQILLKVLNNSKEMSWQEFNISKWMFQLENNDEKKIKLQINELEGMLEYNNKNDTIEEKRPENYIYSKFISKDEEYFIEEIDKVMGDALWRIGKLTDNGKIYTVINTIEVTTPSKIEFFENGLGFLERPTNIYCEKSELLITHDSGKTFKAIEFPERKFYGI